MWFKVILNKNDIATKAFGVQTWSCQLGSDPGLALNPFTLKSAHTNEEVFTLLLQHFEG